MVLPIQVTALEFEALALSQERPIPIPIPELLGVPLNPLLFPANWSNTILIETRWQTDITRPKGSTRTERWALTTRPSRTVSSTINGLSKQESHALHQALLKLSDQRGAPTPLYPDAVPVEQVNGLVISGDFRFRRFFEGARVVVMSMRHSSSKSSDEVFLATIDAISPTSLTVDAAPRAITSRDMVIPCIDAEISVPDSVTAFTDTVLEVSVQWQEIEGASTLPGAWPPVEVGNAEVLSPFCSILDGLAIFPFNPNWADSVEITPARDIQTSTSGRSSISHGDGPPYHEISFSVMGYDRESCWKVSRFFDSMQGRAASFYMIHPLSPWEPFAPLVPSVDQCRIQPTGDSDAIAHYFKRVVLTRANGEMLTRTLTGTVDNGDHFALLFDEDLPDEDFVSVQPIMICAFDSDTLTEVWSTSTVVSGFELSMSEIPDAGPATAGNEVQLGFELAFPGFEQYGGLNLLVRAGVGCFNAAGEASHAWPGKASKVLTWRDVSRGPNRQNNPVLFEREMVEITGKAELFNFQQEWANNKQPAIAEPYFSLPFQTSTAWPNDTRRLWSPDGWTVCVCFTPHQTTLTGDRNIIKIMRPGSTPAFVVRILGTLLEMDVQQQGAPQTSHTAIGLIGAPLTWGFPVILTFRVDSNANVIHGWANGAPLMSAGGFPLPEGIHLTADYVESLWFSGLAVGLPPATALEVRALYSKYGCANLALSYDNPLPIEDINEIHQTISDMYRTLIVPSTIY